MVNMNLECPLKGVRVEFTPSYNKRFQASVDPSQLARFFGFPCKWTVALTCDMTVGQNQWYHFGVGAPPILVYFSGDWDFH